jgi:hypothetical protein
MEDLREHGHLNISIVLVSNKNDCNSHERQVSSREGEQLALKYDLKYFPVSAKTH